MLTLLLTIIIFSILVLVHEFGHFIVAKRSGMKVEEFGMGLPPRAKTLWTDKSGTKYTLNWIPFGGFVRLYGEQDPTRAGSDKRVAISGNDETTPFEKGSADRTDGGFMRNEMAEEKTPQPSSTKRVFDIPLAKGEDFSQAKNQGDAVPFFLFPLWQRMMVVVAGVIMNIILAIVLLTVVFSVGFMPMAIVPDGTLPMNSYLVQSESFARENHVLEIVDQKDAVLIDHTEPGSVAEKSGIQAGDKVVGVGAEKITSAKQLIALLTDARGKSVTINLIRETQPVEQTIVLEKDQPFGVYIDPGEKYNSMRFSPPVALIRATEEVGKQSILTGVVLKNTIVQLVETRSVPEGVSGPVGIFQMTGEVAQYGIIPIVIFVALLSISLAVMNILPFPALDGGRFLFLIIEFISRKRPSPKVETIIHAVGFVILILLIFVITWNDVGKLF